MRKFFTLFVALIIATVLWAEKFQYGDLYYNITSSSEPYTVEVTYENDKFSYNYPGLTTVTIPRTVTYYGTTYSVTSIGADAFNSCYYLESINIPNSVTSIEYRAFQDCHSLTSIIIPNSVTSIEYRAFQDCHSLTSIIIPNSVTRIRNKAFDGTGIYRKKTNWENGVLYISHWLIEANISISGSYSIKDNTRLIGDFAFQNCSSITSIIIPNGVTSIGEGAFEYCSSLKSITCEAETPPTAGLSAFRGINTEIPVYVPCGCVVAYKVANEWKSFTNIQVSSLDCEEDDIITCDEAVMLCEATGTTITTEQYTIRGYVTEIKTAYSEQYNNITFWMADISPTQMDNSSNSVTSLSDYPNIALGKSTTASSSEDSGTLPEYINDGDFNTRWSSEWQDNEYITIDLEQYSFIDHITLHWETAYASQFAILITDEHPSSSTLSSPLPSSATYYQSSGDVQTIPVAKSGRYITLIEIERATAYGISLYELEAYGMPLLQAYCVKPIQSTDKYVQIGDYVEAVGTLVNYGGTTPEINAGGTYTILTKDEENGSTTSVENTNTQSSMTNCQKILYEDHIYILREDKIYSVMGQEL